MTAFLCGSRWYWKFYFRGKRYGPKFGYPSNRKAMDAEFDRRYELGALRSQRFGPFPSLYAALAQYEADVLPSKASATDYRRTSRLLRAWT